MVYYVKYTQQTGLSTRRFKEVFKTIEERNSCIKRVLGAGYSDIVFGQSY